jgi:hypothetical protein
MNINIYSDDGHPSWCVTIHLLRINYYMYISKRRTLRKYPSKVFELYIYYTSFQFFTIDK